MPIGKIEVFNEANEDWSTYVERVEQYFLASEIEEEKQAPTILSLLCSKTYIWLAMKLLCASKTL